MRFFFSVLLLQSYIFSVYNKYNGCKYKSNILLFMSQRESHFENLILFLWKMVLKRVHHFHLIGFVYFRIQLLLLEDDQWRLF